MARLLLTVLLAAPSALALAVGKEGGAAERALAEDVLALRNPSELPVPHRPLEWSDVNIISTSDTHGMYLSLAMCSDCQVGSGVISM